VTKADERAALRAAQEAFGALADERGACCANCGGTKRDGPLEVHHVLPRQALRRLGLDEWDPDLGLVLCSEPSPNRCHDRHTNAFARVPHERLRPENIAIAERYGLTWLLERNHPRGGTDAR
jgi:hypothetical protein